MNSSKITTKKPQKPCLKKYHHTKENYKKCGTKHPKNAYQIFETNKQEKLMFKHRTTCDKSDCKYCAYISSYFTLIPIEKHNPHIKQEVENKK